GFRAADFLPPPGPQRHQGRPGAPGFDLVLMRPTQVRKMNALEPLAAAGLQPRGKTGAIGRVHAAAEKLAGQALRPLPGEQALARPVAQDEPALVRVGATGVLVPLLAIT